MYDQANCASGGSILGGGSINAAQARRGELSELAERVAQAGKRAAEMRSHLTAIANRVFGQTPESEGEMPSPLRGDSDVAMIHGGIDTLETMLSGLDREISRLSRL